MRDHRALANKIFAVLWLVSVGSLVASGFGVDGYRLYVMRVPLPHPYPVAGVFETSLGITLELGLIYAVIRPATYARSWGRALCASAVAAMMSLASVISRMHAPPFVVMHCFAIMCWTVGLVVLSLVSGLTAIRLRRARSPN